MKIFQVSTKFFSVFILVSLCASSSFLCVGCGDPEPPAFMQGDDETFSLTEIVEAGVYKNMDESMEDHLIINDDNTISLVNFDGHEVAEIAIENGAVALIVERKLANVKIPQVVVRNTRKVMLKICNRFFKNPLKNLKIIGVVI